MFQGTLKAFFDKFHIKQKHFANIVGVTEVTISNWLSGKSQPTEVRRKHIEKIMQTYWKAMFPDYYSWCCDSLAKDVVRSDGNSNEHEGACTSCWKFGLVSERKGQ